MEKYAIRIKKVSVGCPRGEEMLQLAAKGINVAAAVPVLIEKQGATWKAFADSIQPENAFGRVVDITADGGIAGAQIEIDPQEIADALPYEIRLTGIEAGSDIMYGEVHVATSCVVETGTEEKTANIEEEKKRILDEGILGEDILEENIRIMQSHRVDEDLMLRTLGGYRNYGKPSINPKTIYVDPEPGSKEESIFSECLRAAVDGFAVIYEGDKSVGKNVCAETVAKVLNKPYYLITFSKLMTPDDIYGTKSTDNSAAAELTLDLALALVEVKTKGQGASEEALKKAAEFELLKAKSASVSIVQDASEFCEWLIGGGVMVFNEMNMAEANFLASFANQITDNTGYLFVPGRGRIEINPDCTLIGTQNAEYTGTCEQNDATTSRFGCIEFPYPKSIKAQLKAASKVKLDDKYFAQCDSLYKILLSSVRDGSLSNSCLNIRGFVRALQSTAKGNGHVKLSRQIDIHVISTCPLYERTPLRVQLKDTVNL